MKKSAQGIIEAVAEPPGANMHFSTAVPRARLCMRVSPLLHPTD